MEGPLLVVGARSTAMWCGGSFGVYGCCNGDKADVVVGDPPRGYFLTLPHYCSGDDSRLCCTAPAFGQEVVAIGKLVPPRSDIPRERKRWHLRDVDLCLPETEKAALKFRQWCSRTVPH